MVLGHDAAELLELEPDEVALIALPSIKQQGAVCWNNLNQGSRAEMNRDGVTDEETLRRVSWKLAAAWQWLLNEGLLAPHPGQDHPWYMATERAFAMADPLAHLSEVRSLSLLRRAKLDPALTERVLPIFRRALYSAAVFQAMLEVEVRVRDLSGLSLNGVDLMKQAFRAQPAGPLSDPGAGVGDREARMALFWGAIGEYRNEAGHNPANPDDPQEAAEAVLLANGLLRMVESVRVRLRPAPTTS